MIDLRPILSLLRAIVERWHPEQVWLFGSRATGFAGPQSDWDLLVVVPDDLDEKEIEPLEAWQVRRRSGIRADVVLCRASEFAEDRATPNTLAHEVASSGVLVHER